HPVLITTPRPLALTSLQLGCLVGVYYERPVRETLAFAMWTDLRNRSTTLSDQLRDANLSQVIFPAPSQAPLASHRNGSTVASPAPLTESPVPKRSGIIPGAIAAALFIGFILALYTVLWKCMVSPPKRGKRKRVLKGVRGAV
ncbi:hypothetical protein SRHO_G00330090, partial [Serrasalmus rhombeus]